MNIEYKIELQEEHIPVRGNALASGDDAEDKRVEDEIINRLNCGDMWAWCSVRVVAYIPGIDLEGDDYLGGCCYTDENDFKQCGYFEDMKKQAKTDLLNKINAVKALG